MYRIKELAKEKGITVSLLAEHVETTQPNLSAIINNKAKPSVDMLQRIADALQVHISELFEQPQKDEITGFVKVKGELKEIKSVKDLRDILDKL